jgi:hypothetical protein
MKKLPIGIQTFDKIIEGDYIYVDKTEYAYNLINDYTYIFLSRPRRFGKSLFLDTLKAIFEGRKELFEGLYIYDKWDWSKKYPVIKISWDGKLQTLEDLENKARVIFKFNQERLGVRCEESGNSAICFEELIKLAHDKYNEKVVVLIDEYDKPILDVLDNLEQAKLHREFIKGLYSVIKGSDAYIRFAFLTGVSKFSRASIFSGLNMLTDISLNPKYGNICGYTQKDIETTFMPYLEGVDMEKLKIWYNGYNFLQDNVYNPFDILQFIASGHMYRNYWFETGTPSFLIKLLKQRNYFLPKLSDLKVDDKLLSTFDIEHIDIEVILYQSGYLTIDKMITNEILDTIEYTLKIPNKEVQISFNDYVIRYLLNGDVSEKEPLMKSLLSAELDKFKESLISIFASIPYNNFSKNNLDKFEGFYSSIIYVHLASLGIKIIGEDVTNEGRIDLTCFVKDKIYILEFKVDGQKGEALSQIKSKNYALKYKNSPIYKEYSEIYLVGIEFDSAKRNIENFEWEKYL